ncbi:hypothetical protein [Opitutus sp. ER46]|uniref:hypothetical protein n=1 Tax=Opitutus sp. ER46 TaxID=2161864 RepID=UPI000D324E7E|nr:hypothetical protein [Opitutus sp. ER46]PTX95772.1 hypothetical protein DB354_10195 [Opitutus sp. ER46]
MATDRPPSKTSIIFAGEIFAGQDADHPHIRDIAGNPHAVRVRAMPARHLGRVLELCTDEAGLLELVLQRSETDADGKLIGWVPVDAAFVDNLDDSSHDLLVHAASRQNFQRAATWGERAIAAKTFQAPLLLKADEALSPVIQRMVRLLISSLPQSGSPAAPTTSS